MSALWRPPSLADPRAGRPLRQVPVLDRNHELSAGLQLGVVFSSGGGLPIELDAQRVHTIGAGATWEQVPFGYGLRGASNTSHVQFSGVTNVTTTITIYLLVRHLAVGGVEQGLLSPSSPSAANNTWLNVICTTGNRYRFERHIGATTYANSLTTTAPTDGVWYGLACRLDGTNRSIWFGQFGAPLAKEDEDADSNILTSCGGTGSILQHGPTAWSSHYRGAMALGYVWPGRAFNDGDLQALHDDPWAFMRDDASAWWWLGARSADNSAAGTAAITLSPVAIAATGAQEIAGTAALTLAQASLSASGIMQPAGTAALDLAAAAVAASGAETYTGVAALNLAGALIAASGVETAIATSAITLANMALAANGVETITGTAALSLAAAVIAATGSAGAAPTGAAALALSAVSLAASGQEEVPGAAALSLFKLALNAVGVMQPEGTAVIQLSPAEMLASGTSEQNATGTAALQLAAVMMAAAAADDTPGGDRRRGFFAGVNRLMMRR